MSAALPIITLPNQEHWDCHHCGICCRGNIIPLSDDDLRKLREQRWGEDPDFRGVKVIVAQGLFAKSHELAKRSDGSCVFLSADGLCAIHKKFGLEAKPLVCQTFPLQLVPWHSKAILTVRRSCPSAVLDQGRPVSAHVADARTLARQQGLIAESPGPPRIAGRVRLDWPAALRVLAALERLLLDPRFPIVRRLVHGLAFCDLLEKCRLERVEPKAVGELTSILEQSAVQDESVAAAFRERTPPGRATAVLFRQTAALFVRLHPDFYARDHWRERWQLARTAVRFARGTGPVPRLHSAFPETTFAELERPLGALAPDLYRPLERFYETTAASHQYAIVQRPSWSIVENFRALAITYPVALWLLRWMSTGRAPTQADVVPIITALDRGLGYAPLTGRRHRSCLTTLSRLGELPKLFAWYAR